MDAECHEKCGSSNSGMPFHGPIPIVSEATSIIWEHATVPVASHSMGTNDGEGGFVTARICFLDGSVDAVGDQTIEDAVRSSGRIPDSYVYLIAGRPVPMDTVPPEDSEVRAMRVASGG